MSSYIEVKNVSKSFSGRAILQNISLPVEQGTTVGLVGANGSGKSVLFKIICGFEKPDQGSVYVRGNQLGKNGCDFPESLGVFINSPGFIGIYSGFQNLKFLADIQGKIGEKEIRQAMSKVGLDPDNKTKVDNYSLGMKQKLGLAQAIMEGQDILILDEPTAVLTPQETRRLFDVLRRMREDGKSIIIITHKLHEVLEISDRVVILRKGKNVGNVATKDATEQSLTELMVGEKIDLHIERTAPKDPQERLRVEHLTVRNKEGAHVLEDVNFTANGGEILGIAGISGCGQKELLEAIAGLQASEKGSSIVYKPADGQAVNLVGKSPKAIRSLGIALSFVPEDRLGMGLVGNMDIVDNMMLRSYKRGHTAFLERKRPKDLAENIIKSLEIVTPDANTPVRRLSGGNVQKVLVGREIAQHPTVLMVAYPVRGLDINSSYMIYNLLQKQKESGVSVIFVGEDLDVLVELCDRIMVLNSGRITGIVDGPSATKEELGILMTKRVKEEGETHA